MDFVDQNGQIRRFGGNVEKMENWRKRKLKENVMGNPMGRQMMWGKYTHKYIINFSI
jgi:hypothetical protein